uniref:NAC domain-containing protein n=1 Tax=Ananas comosus var. bracteatus TaxID=296719 RepID=A0A6V7QMW8_ANACO|nr:unnamed protein product [Ananas comosus var. bracteatus]
MDTTESCVPPGFRFHPTDEELVGYYLKKKVASQKIDLDVIRDIDLYRIEPWDLQEHCRIGYEEQSEWYFFSHKDRKYPTGTRTNRATMAGFWKATGRDKAIHDKNKLIGMRKTLVFYKGRAPNGQKTDWIMHEYRLESEENGPPQASSKQTYFICAFEQFLSSEEGWVVCRAFKKRTSCASRSAVDLWECNYSYDEPIRMSSIVADPLTYLQRPPKQADLLCKQETELDNANVLQSNHFVQLPQLESPSIPLVKWPSLLSSVAAVENDDDEQTRGCHVAEKVTDWRALDKFVAAQLSPEDQFAADQVVSGYGVDQESEMALLLLQGGCDINEAAAAAGKLSGFLSSSGSECDIGICVFEK